MRFVNTRQQKRDHTGLRNCCSACGHDGTPRDPLQLDDEGMRVHESHLTDPASGLYGKGQG